MANTNERYYTDLLPLELRYELLMYISLKDIMPIFRPFGVHAGNYTLNKFYARYITKNYWVHRLSVQTRLPRDAFVDFLNDTSQSNVVRFLFKINDKL